MKIYNITGEMTIRETLLHIYEVNSKYLTKIKKRLIEDGVSSNQFDRAKNIITNIIKHLKRKETTEAEDILDNYESIHEDVDHFVLGMVPLNDLPGEKRWNY